MKVKATQSKKKRKKEALFYFTWGHLFWLAYSPWPTSGAVPSELRGDPHKLIWSPKITIFMRSCQYCTGRKRHVDGCRQNKWVLAKTYLCASARNNLQNNRFPSYKFSTKSDQNIWNEISQHISDCLSFYTRCTFIIIRKLLAELHKDVIRNTAQD